MVVGRTAQETRNAEPDSNETPEARRPGERASYGQLARPANFAEDFGAQQVAGANGDARSAPARRAGASAVSAVRYLVTVRAW